MYTSLSEFGLAARSAATRDVSRLVKLTNFPRIPLCLRVYRCSKVPQSERQAARKMANSLPNDVLFIVCSQLSQQRDFHTLLQCALTGKQLANPALTLLYR